MRFGGTFSEGKIQRILMTRLTAVERLFLSGWYKYTPKTFEAIPGRFRGVLEGFWISCQELHLS